jgi:hypothetical protein
MRRQANMTVHDDRTSEREPDDRLWRLGLVAALAWAAGFAAREFAWFAGASWVARVADGVVALSIGAYLLVLLLRRCPECNLRLGLRRRCPSCAGTGKDAPRGA